MPPSYIYKALAKALYNENLANFLYLECDKKDSSIHSDKISPI